MLTQTYTTPLCSNFFFFFTLLFGNRFFFFQRFYTIKQLPVMHLASRKIVAAGCYHSTIALYTKCAVSTGMYRNDILPARHLTPICVVIARCNNCPVNL